MDTKFLLMSALLDRGRAPLAEHLGISESELSKKINEENGWRLEQLAKALDFVGAKIAPQDQVVIKKSEYSALRTLARKQLEVDED